MIPAGILWLGCASPSESTCEGGYWLHGAKRAGLSGPARPVSCVDCLHQSANAQNLHHAFHVVGEHVQRHFGADVLERFHLEVRRSHPRLYRAERMLDRPASLTHLFRMLIEPALDGTVLAGVGPVA